MYSGRGSVGARTVLLFVRRSVHLLVRSRSSFIVPGIQGVCLTPNIKKII